MVGFLSRDYRSIRNQWEMNTRVWHQISLKFSEIHIQCSVKTERGSDGGYNLANQSVKICIRWTFNVKVATADIINGLYICLKLGDNVGSTGKGNN